MAGDDDEWQVVTKSDRKRIARRQQKGRYQSSYMNNRSTNGRANGNSKSRHGPEQRPGFKSAVASTPDALSETEIQHLLDECTHEIGRSDFFQDLQSQLFGDTPALPLHASQPTAPVDVDAKHDASQQHPANDESVAQSGPQIREMICYGIGNFSHGSSSLSAASGPMWQLACACALRDIIHKRRQHQQGDSSNPFRSVKLHYFDPCMTPVEAAILVRNSFHIIETNERGNRSIGGNGDHDNGDQTIFFMPHCPMMLYSNVLYTNWDHLQRSVIIIGNSLTDYADRLLAEDHALRSSQAVLKAIQPCMEQHAARVTKSDIQDMPGYFENAFNDTCLIRFRSIPDAAPIPKPPDPNESSTNNKDGELL